MKFSLLLYFATMVQTIIYLQHVIILTSEWNAFVLYGGIMFACDTINGVTPEWDFCE